VFEQQDFDVATAGTLSAQPGSKHPGVVSHQHVTRAEMRREIAEALVSPTSCGAVEDHQSRVPAKLGGMLGDLRRRQVEIELVDAHASEGRTD
jgi:hypothetical protein